MALYKAVTDRRYSQIWQRVRSAMVCTSGKCLPEIAPQGHFLALRAQGATSAVGLLAMTNQGASRHFICATAIPRRPYNITRKLYILIEIERI